MTDVGPPLPDLGPAWPGRRVPALIEELLDLRATIAELRGRERDLVEMIHATAYDAGIGRKFEAAGAQVELARSRNKRWDHEEAMRHVVARALDERTIDPDTGEVEPSWATVARAVMECAGIGYWRVGALKDKGLDPDEFFETTSWSPSVRVHPKATP